jgi:Spy/CpxP family protein refolding chaperone
VLRRVFDMSLEKGTRTRLTTVVILFLVLATGFVLGIAVDRRLEARAGTADARWPGSGGRGPGVDRAGGRGQSADTTTRRRSLLVEQVGLTDVQKEQIDSIVAHYRGKRDALQAQLEADLWEAYMPRSRELLEETREEIKSVLTPEQRTAYDSLLVERDRRREERRSRDSVPDSGG